MVSTLQWILFVALASVGTATCLLAGIGLLRLPDVYTRMQAASKASTLGAGAILTATAIYSEQTDVTIRAMLIVLFLFITAPVAAHMIARAAYLTGVPLAQGTAPDELAGRYDTRTHALASTGETEAGPANDDPPAA